MNVFDQVVGTTAMEEVDKIIIESLKHLNCNIDDEVTSLKYVEPDTVVAAITTCLESMNPQLKLPKKLPSSMSAKIKFASNLAQQIRDQGFRGDMGYQTILYCNEVEVRRVLMFLIERLPKESSPVASIEPIGYVPRVVKQIEDSLKESISRMWLPSEVLNFGTRDICNGIIVNSFGNSCPLDGVRLVSPSENIKPDEQLYIPNISEQCSSRQLIPSLLFQDIEFSVAQDWKQKMSRTSLQEKISTDIFNITGGKSVEKVSQDVGELNSGATKDDGSKYAEIKDNKVDSLLEQVNEKRNAYISLQDDINAYEEKLAKMQSQRNGEQSFLKDSIAKVKVKNKTLAILNNEENMTKLKNLIQKAENRLVELSNQWNDVETPLLEEYKTLKSSLSSENLKYQDEQAKLRKLKSTYRELVENFKSKSALEQTLMERCKELNNKNNRAAYTKRILEIVGNIKKQNAQIQKTLADTKQVQKDIKNLTGQVDRSFTLSDELIFFNCKHDESARKAYKFLAALREEFNGMLQAISDIGQAERELRNLEEQVETEKSREVRIKLEKVQHDLVEIKKEIQLLM